MPFAAGANGPATLPSSVLAASGASNAAPGLIEPAAAVSASSSADVSPPRLTGSALDDVEELLDVEELDEEELEQADLAAEDGPALNGGFHAFLRHASLHNLLQIESLSRTTGVFLVLSGASRGYLHLAGGELVHAESGGLSGEAAALEILSWEDGEFKSCSRTLAPVRTVHSSLQHLLLRLARDLDEGAGAPHRQRASQVVRRALDQDAPTETSLLPPDSPAVSAPAGALSAASAPSPAPVTRPSATPPPLPAPSSLAEVTLNSAGEIMDCRGAASEDFSARVAYAARLAELIGRAIRSGTPRGLELRGKRTHTNVRWQADGSVSAALDPVTNSRR